MLLLASNKSCHGPLLLQAHEMALYPSYWGFFGMYSAGWPVSSP
jgi:hypothetical protein